MDRGAARLAERGRARSVLEEEVMAMSVEGLVDSAGRYIGRMHPLAFAFLASSGDDVGFVAKSFRRALPDGRFQRGEPEADGLVFGFEGPERGLLVGAALEVAELVGRGVSQVVYPHLPQRGLPTDEVFGITMALQLDDVKMAKGVSIAIDLVVNELPNIAVDAVQVLASIVHVDAANRIGGIGNNGQVVGAVPDLKHKEQGPRFSPRDRLLAGHPGIEVSLLLYPTVGLGVGKKLSVNPGPHNTQASVARELAAAAAIDTAPLSEF